MGVKHSGWAPTYSGSRVSSAGRQTVRKIREPEPTGFSSEDYQRLFAMTDSGLPVEAFLETLPSADSTE